MWQKDLVELLIAKYQEYEHLYNVRHPSYSDRVKRSNSLLEICNELKKINKTITVQDVKKKIHTLRSQFIKEIREIKNSKRSGVGADDVVEPKLWCFNQLTFLKPHCGPRKLVSYSCLLKEDCNVNDNVNPIEEDSTSDISIEIETEPPRQKKHLKEEMTFYEENNDDSQTEESEISVYEDSENISKTKRRYIWDREYLKAFIEMIKGHPILYNPNHKDYAKSDLRRLECGKLLREVRKLDREISIDDIREKMRTFRCQFMKEVRLLKKAQENNERYSPKLWCFQRLADLYKDVIDITPFYNNDVKIDEGSTSSVHELEHTIANDNNGLFEFAQVPENIGVHEEEAYEVESVTIPVIDITQNNGDIKSTFVNKCVSSMERDLKHMQTSKNWCTNNPNIENKATDSREEINKITQSNSRTKHKNIKKSINSNEDINYEWLGNLVVSQLGEIAPKYHTEFAWDVQCLIRKYILKTKTNKDEIATSKSSLKTSTDQRQSHTSHDLLLPKTSNVSFNISFV